jgi:hypothetical protein
MNLKMGLSVCRFTAILGLIFLVVCGKNNKPVVLAVDFSLQPQWKYTMAVQVNGSFIHNDSARNFSNSAKCLLTGTSATGKSGTLSLALSDVAIASDIIDSAEITNLKRQFDDTRMIYSGNTGELSTADPTALPMVHIGGWDLYHTMARVVPALPQNAVSVGTAWERERQIPLISTAGNCIGHLYQTFILDSIISDSNKAQRAYISWKFSYRVEFVEKPVASVANDIPLLGNGTGTAVLNVTGKYLERAIISFKVERNSQAAVSMEWSEHASLVLER